MPIERRTMPIPLDQGLDAGTDPKLAQAPILLENAVFPRRNAVAKRCGQLRSASVVSSKAMTRVVTVNNGVLCYGPTEAVFYVPGTDTAVSLTDTGADERRRFASVAIRTLQMDANPLWMDVVANTTFILAAWVEAPNDSGVCVTRAATFDRATGRMIEKKSWSPPIGTGRSGFPRCAKTSGGVLACAAHGIAAYVQVYEITAAGAFTKVAEITSLNLGTTVDVMLDFVRIADAWAYIRREQSTGRIQVGFAGYGAIDVTTHATNLEVVGLFDLGGGVAGCLWVEDDTDWKIKCCGVALSGGTPTVTISTASYSAAKATWDAVINVSGVARAVSTAVANTVATVAVTLDYKGTPANWSQVVTLHFINTAGVGSFDEDLIFEYAHMLGKPKADRTSSLSLALHHQTRGLGLTDPVIRQSQVIFASLAASSAYGELTYVGKALVGSSRYGDISRYLSGARPSCGIPVCTFADDIAASIVLHRTATDDGASQTATGLAVMELQDGIGTQPALRGSMVFLGGAAPHVFDGQTFYEMGFVTYPEAAKSSTQSAGALSANGSYQWVFLWEFVDASNRRHQSAPSPQAVSHTTNAGGTETPRIYVTPLISNGYKSVNVMERISIVMYRTIANGQVYYRVASAPARHWQREGPWEPFTSAQIGTADATISDNERLYTQGGVLAAGPVPPCGAQVLWKDRLVVASTDADGRLWYSKPLASGVGEQFCSVLRVELDALDSAPTALATAADRLIVATSRALYITGGDGFDALGAGANLDVPSLLSAQVGISTARSIVRSGRSLYFQASDGIWELQDSGALMPVGDRARHYTESLVVADAVALAGIHVICWLDTTGVALVYDTARQAWATWANHASVAGCALGDVLYRLDSSRYLHRRDPTSYADTAGAAKAWVSLTVDTGWLNLAAIGANARLFEWVATMQLRGGHVLNVLMAFDHDPNWHTTKTYNPVTAGLAAFSASDYYGAGLSASYADKAYAVTIYPDWERRFSSAQRMRIYDTTDGSATPTAGYELTALTALVGSTSGVRRSDSARKVGT